MALVGRDAAGITEAQSLTNAENLVKDRGLPNVITFLPDSFDSNSGDCLVAYWGDGTKWGFRVHWNYPGERPGKSCNALIEVCSALGLEVGFGDGDVCLSDLPLKVGQNDNGEPEQLNDPAIHYIRITGGWTRLG
jgi:hypothetical protein